MLEKTKVKIEISPVGDDSAPRLFLSCHLMIKLCLLSL